MKTAFIISSTINVDNQYPLTYNPVRSYFTAEERFRQTLFTINSIDQATNAEDTTIYLLDSSPDWGQYLQRVLFQKNLKFISVAFDWPNEYEAIKSHPNKTHCESLMMSCFLNKHAKELEQFDYIFKMSGRYYVNSSFDIGIIENNPDKILYKKYREHDWQDHWGYEMVDMRDEQGDNKLRQYCSVIFGWGKKYQKSFADMYTAMASITDRPDMRHYDIETLGYFLTRPWAEDIIETDWIVHGWHGPDGMFVRY
jgi:hypothetical protein